MNKDVTEADGKEDNMGMALSFVKLYDELFKKINSFDSSGLGEVYHSLSDFFEKDRMKATRNILVRNSGIFLNSFWGNRKTSKSTIEPERYKGWKGSR